MAIDTDDKHEARLAKVEKQLAWVAKDNRSSLGAVFELAG